MTRRQFLQAASAIPMLHLLPTGKLEEILRLAEAKRWRELPIGDLMVTIGEQFLGTPYVGGTLDVDAQREKCIVNLAGLDCVTFFESCLGIATLIKDGGVPADLVAKVTHTRYRDGQLNGYVSRLHYTTDWFRDNVRKGTVKDVTPTLKGATKLPKPLNFMSTHPESYAALKAHPELVAKISEIEARLSREPLAYIPSAEIKEIEPFLKSGDIVGILTDREGLDYSHTGLIKKEGAVARFMHASSSAMKVILDGGISSYVQNRKGALGASFVRPLEP